MVHADLTIVVERVELLTGVWCDRCLVSSAVSLTYALHFPGGRTTIATRTGCTNDNHEEK